MTIPFFALTSLIILIPAFGLADRFFGVGAISAILALAFAAAALEMTNANIDRFNRLMRPILLIVLGAPAFWMTLQILPAPAHGLANDIWFSASTALNQQLTKAITVDFGETLFSLAQYFSFVAAVVITAAVALDRQRAEGILDILIAILALFSARRIVIELGWFYGDAADNDESVLLSLAGIILSCAVALSHYDRSRHPRTIRGDGRARFTIAGIAFVTCAAVILTQNDNGAIIATLLGMSTLGALFVIRNWMLGPWGKAGVAAALGVALFCALAISPVMKDENRVENSPMQSHAATERMLTDIPIAGSGAGTYESLLPIYQDLVSASHRTPTGAEVIAIEMGRAFFVVVVIALLCGAWVLFHRSLARKKDYVFAGVGAALLAAGFILIFFNGGMFGPGASFLLGVIGGLALGQSLSASLPYDRGLARQAVSIPADSAQHDETACPAWRTPSRIWPRFAFALVALGLVAQAAWLLSADIYATGQRVPDQSSILPDAARERIQKAAEIAVVRGDLWAQSALAQLAPHETESGMEIRSGPAALTALRDLNQAVRYAPHRSEVWLMFALLAERYKPVGFDVGALLKMSYYTAPNDLALLVPRLAIALTAKSAVEDLELRELIRRDIDIVINRRPTLRPALVTAYRSASPEQKRVAEHLIAEVDPSYLETIRQQ